MIKVERTRPYSDANVDTFEFRSMQEVHDFLEQELRMIKDEAHAQIDKDFYAYNFDAYADTPEEAHVYFEEHYHIEWHDGMAYISYPGYHYTEGYCDEYKIIEC